MVSNPEKPVRPSEKNERAPRTLRRMWGLEDEEEDPFKDDGRWMEGWMKDIKEEEERKKEEERGEEEGLKPKFKSTEPRPSKREIEEHMVTHIPFRSWCPHCVRGKARAKYHAW